MRSEAQKAADKKYREKNKIKQSQQWKSLTIKTELVNQFTAIAKAENITASELMQKLINIYVN